MKSIKKIFALLISVIMLLDAFILVSCAKTLRTTTWTGAFTAFYNDEVPESPDGSIAVNATHKIRVGKTNSGGDIFSFVRIPLGVDFFANEITEAKLFLYAAEGDLPKELLIGTVNGRWTVFTKRTEAKALVDNNALTVATLQPEDDGWVSVLVTDIVKAWMRADIQNFGFALFPLEGEAQGVFADMYNDDGNTPYLKVSGRVGKRPSGYGKYGFTRVPEEGRLDDTVNGNCLAYAVRDSVPVYLEDLGSSYPEVNRVLSESGEDGVADFIGGLFEKYVEEHKTALRVSKLRRIDGFKSSIDPAKEYRIVMRLGCYATEDQPLSENARNFDFHFLVQLNDGRWSQKYGWSYSEIIPATGSGISPEKYYWEMSKYGYLYRSKLLYYAVTKDTDEITVHRPSPFADVELYDYVNNGVEYVYKYGFMTGTNDAPMLFSPDTALTRGMAAEVFYRMAGSPDAGKFANPFNDVDTGNRYYDAVKWATANGIIFDYSGSGKFAPDRNITREEAAAAFYNYQRLSGVIPPDVLFEREPEDVNEISKWAREAAKKLMMQMIFRSPGSLFIPKGEITRIEFAGLLRDYCEYSKR